MIENMGGKIKGGILTAFGVILIIVGSVATFYMLQYIYGITLGSIFHVALNGSLPVSDNTIDFLNTSEQQFFSSMGTLRIGMNFALGLVIVAIVLLVFGGLILGYQYAHKKKGGDMGY